MHPLHQLHQPPPAVDHLPGQVPRPPPGQDPRPRPAEFFMTPLSAEPRRAIQPPSPAIPATNLLLPSLQVVKGVTSGDGGPGGEEWGPAPRLPMAAEQRRPAAGGETRRARRAQLQGPGGCYRGEGHCRAVHCGDTLGPAGLAVQVSPRILPAVRESRLIGTPQLIHR